MQYHEILPFIRCALHCLHTSMIMSSWHSFKIDLSQRGVRHNNAWNYVVPSGSHILRRGSAGSAHNMTQSFVHTGKMQANKFNTKEITVNDTHEHTDDTLRMSTPTFQSRRCVLDSWASTAIVKYYLNLPNDTRNPMCCPSIVLSINLM